MINKVSQLKTALFIIVFLNFNLFSQVPYSAFNVPPVIFTGIYSSGAQASVVCNGETNQFTSNGNDIYAIQGQNYIRFKQPSSFQHSTSGFFHAFLTPAPFEVVSYHQNGWTGIPRYDKFELGVKLPQNLTDNINNFFDTNFVGTIGYGHKFNPNFINPYDPDKISVEATFSFPGQTPQVVYGFYYREYTYSTGNAVPSYYTNWIEDTTLQYHWRVRYTPKFVGTYTVTWVVKVNNQIVLQNNIGQNFTTIPSSDKGFLKLNPPPNNKFLVTQPDPLGPQTTILPIGVCVDHAAAAITSTDPVIGLPYLDCGNYGCNDIYYPAKYWAHREKIRTKIADQGGNYVRLVNAPYNYDIEYEVAGVYDAKPCRPIEPGLTWSSPGVVPALCPSPYAPSPQNYKGTNRQAIMWEFDRMLDMAKANNIYIQWSLLHSGDHGFSTSPLNYTWPGNVYFNLSGANPSVTNGFFTVPAAIKAYKNRLRYMIARFGYSQNLAAFEMVNEIDTYRGINPPYNISGSVSDLFAPWLDTMSSYIKKPISQGGLGHTDHLLTVSYQWASGLGNLLPNVDNIRFVQNLDFLSRHPYHDATPPNYDDGTDLYFGAFTDTRTLSVNSNNKPVQAGEMGLRADWGCSNQPGNHAAAEFRGPTFHSLLWSTTFMGGLTSGLDNWDSGLDITGNPDICGNGFITHFKPLQNFIQGVNFNQGNYVPKYFPVLPGNPPVGTPVEAFYMVDNGGVNGQHAIGFFRNRSFWWFNFTNPGSGQFYDPALFAQFQTDVNGCGAEPNSPSSQAVLTGNIGNVLIDGLQPNTPFVVDWYDTYSDPNVFLFSSPPVSTSISGNLLIIPPSFGAVFCNEHEYAFKIHLVGQQRAGSSSTPDTLNYSSVSMSLLYPKPPQSNKVIKADDAVLNGALSIYPNPGTGSYIINASKETIYTLDIFNAYGAKVKSLSFKGTRMDVSIENMSNGIYTFVIKSEDGTYVKKVIKQ